MRDVISAVLEYCLFGAVPVGCALLGIGRYRKNAKEDILRIRGECGSMDEYVSALRAEGGTSVGLAVVGVLLTLAVAGCLMYLPWIIVAVFM